MFFAHRRTAGFVTSQNHFPDLPAASGPRIPAQNGYAYRLITAVFRQRVHRPVIQTGVVHRGIITGIGIAGTVSKAKQVNRCCAAFNIPAGRKPSIFPLSHPAERAAQHFTHVHKSPFQWLLAQNCSRISPPHRPDRWSFGERRHGGKFCVSGGDKPKRSSNERVTGEDRHCQCIRSQRQCRESRIPPAALVIARAAAA